MKRPYGLWLLCSLLFLPSLASAVPPVSFAPHTDYATGPRCFGVSIGDLNHDGMPDLVAANSISNTVSVLLGDGVGGFGSKTDFTTADRPFVTAIRDLNGDGKPDLVVACELAPGAVSVLLNTTPAGATTVTFDPKTDFATGNNAIGLALGDLNHDGNLDVAVAKLYTNTVAVLLGNGLGGFGSYTDFSTGTYPDAVAIEDLNLDGKLDLVVANDGIPYNTANTVSVLLNITPAGATNVTFDPKTDIPTGVGPGQVVIGDLNGDGKLDLATANSGASSVSVLLGDGLGGFNAQTEFGAGDVPYGLAIGDLNGDGKPDLATTSNTRIGGTSNTVSVLLGDGVGGFASKTDFATDVGPGQVAIGDLDGDGRLDLATGNELDGTVGTVSVLLNKIVCVSPASFAPKTDFPTGTGPIQVAIGDLNADGKLDLALANNTTPGAVSVLLGDGVGGFGTSSPFSTGNGSWSVVIGDLDGDGKPDLAVANRVSNNVSIMVNTTPAGGATPSFTHILPDFATGNGPTEISIGDLNSDGKPDLVTANSFAGTVSVLINTTPLGSPANFQRLNPDPQAGTGPASVAIGDLDHNGALDLAVANHQSSNVSVLLGNGDGTFGLHNEFTIGGESYSVAIGDLNRDGKPDLATASYVANTVSVLFGNGNGTFGPKSDIAVGGPTTAVAIGDLNQDGKLDLTATHDVPSVSVMLGNGNGTFGPNADFATGDAPSWVAIADLDRDGRPDLAVSDNNSNAVSVLLNNIACGLLAVTDSPPSGHLELSATPNPFSGQTKISFTLPRSGPATVAIYDVLGRRLRQWDWSTMIAGQHQVEWNGLAEDSHRVAPGVLFYRLSAGGQTLKEKIIRMQ